MTQKSIIIAWVILLVMIRQCTIVKMKDSSDTLLADYIKHKNELQEDKISSLRIELNSYNEIINSLVIQIEQMKTIVNNQGVELIRLRKAVQENEERMKNMDSKSLLIINKQNTDRKLLEKVQLSLINSVSHIYNDVKHLHQNVHQYHEISSSKTACASQFVSFIAYATRVRNYNMNDVIAFDSSISNNGGAYNPITNKFCCPVTGYYLFTVNILADILSRMRFDIRIDGKRVVSSSAGVSDSFGQGSATVVTLCKAHQTVWVGSMYNKERMYGSSIPYSTFSGALLHCHL